MYMDGWTPDIVVGIDFGMTCTGVAWSRGPAWAEPKTFQHWPGKMIHELANKVPTIIQYTPGSSSVSGWGFLCDQDSEDPGLIDYFKLHLDPSFREDARPDRPTTQQARQWYVDYLRAIHDHIASVFSDTIPRWRDQKAEFVFSVPTTWKNPSMIAEIEQLLRSAGFGSDGGNHRAKIGLTEAEAAAVYASKQQYEKDDVLLICDAGGGTTDVNVLKIMSSKAEPVSLKPLSWVEGRPVGSIAIDNEFHVLIVDRLGHIQDQLREDPDTVANRMMREDGRFERFKCSYGTALSNLMPTLPLRVPGLLDGVYHPEAMIENSSMIFSRDDLKRIFNIQMNKILTLTDEQLDRVSQHHPSTQVSYLVLSGGLGSSAYVKERLRSHYKTGPGSFRPAIEKMEIATVEEPQLAVVQGLVTDRIHSISLGTEIFSERCCSQSYGVVCAEKHDPNLKRHLGQEVRRDTLDGETWVDGQIQWFIQQGQTVSINGVTKPFTIKRKMGTEFEPWQTQIVMSTVPRERLPTNIKQDGSRRLCEVSTNLKTQEVEMKEKNRHWYSRRERYLRFRFDVKAVVGAADLKFVLLTKDKKVINDDYNAIEVVWQPAMEPASVNANGTVPLYYSLT
ncbi:hypothetical protein MMC21_007015 [Puttea exsequens]|nr:hypothetical protein [Puttea exsequens]